MKQIILFVFLLFSMFNSHAQDLIITEIMYNPSGSTDSDWEWIEIYNNGSDPIDLSGYVLDDTAGTEFSEANISNGMLAPQKSAILFDADAVTAQEFSEAWGVLAAISVANWPSLGNGRGDTIGIWNSFESYSGDQDDQLATIEQLTYENGENGWPTSNGSASIFLSDLDLDNTDGENWAISTEGSETPLNIGYLSQEINGNSGNDVGSPGIPGGLEDTEKPVISCPVDRIVASATDNCGASFPLELPTATDNSEDDLTFEGVRNDNLELIDPFPVGETTITWTAIDAAGNVSEPCVQNILVNDETPPVITCPENIVFTSLDGNSVLLEITEATAIDVCEGELSISGDRDDMEALEAAYPVGETSILWRSVDVAGNTAECVQTITVNFIPSMDNAITAFSIDSQLGETNIDDSNKTVQLIVPFGTDVTALAPNVSISSEAMVSPASEETQDFTEPVVYTVTAQDGTEQNWTITIVVAEEIAITQFFLSTQSDTLDLTDGIRFDSTDALITMNLLGADVRAQGSGAIGSVHFELTGGATDFSRISNAEPHELYAVEGPNSDAFYNEVGIYTLTATPYTEVDMLGIAGASLTITIEIFNSCNVLIEESLVETTKSSCTESNGTAMVNTRILGISPEDYNWSHDTDLEGPTATNLAAGNYSVSFGNRSCETTITFEIEAEDDCPNTTFSITSFTLINADTNEDLFLIEEGMQIDINSLPTLHLDIRANTTADVASVRLSLDGALQTARTESLMPFALYRDLPIGDYIGNDFVLGTYAVTAIPYSEDSLRGDTGSSFTTNFELFDACETFELILDLVSEPVTCDGTEGAATVLANGGVAPITYSWSHDTSIDGIIAVALSAGEYTVRATDANNCTTELIFSLSDPQLPEVSLLPFESVFDTDEPIVLIEGQPFGGTYSGEGVMNGEFDPSIGSGTYEITYTYTDAITGCENSTIGILEVLSSQQLTVESFTLINADTNTALFDIAEGMIIDINSLPTLHLDIRANTSNSVESVRLSLTGALSNSRTESLVPYALFQDLPIGDYRGVDFIVGNYTVSATPFALDSARGDSGELFAVNFELFDSSLSVTEFMLVNADTNEDLFLIEEGMRIDINDLPTLHLDIRANTTDAVESVRLSLAGAITTARTESLVPYALFQDLPIGDYRGNDFVLGDYAVKAVPYSEDALRGNQGNALTVNFELIDAELSGRFVNQMVISPNPANNETDLSFATATEIMKIEIYDANGRLVRSYDGQKVKDLASYKLEIRALQSGNYYVKTQDVHGNTRSGQLYVKKE